MRRTIMATIVAVCVLVGALSTTARADGDYGSQAGWGVLTVLANVVYIPTKLVYATLGGITGALAYPLTIGDTEAVQSVWSPSLGGTYVLTTPMLRGEQPILFSGESYSPADEDRRFVEEPTSLSKAD